MKLKRFFFSWKRRFVCMNFWTFKKGLKSPKNHKICPKSCKDLRNINPQLQNCWIRSWFTIMLYVKNLLAIFRKKTPLELSLRKPVKFLLRARAEGEEKPVDSERRREMVLGSARWASIRIITGTILGGILGFYVMNRLEVRHKASPNSPSLSPPFNVPFLLLLSFDLRVWVFFFFWFLYRRRCRRDCSNMKWRRGRERPT